jgi:hypothetical protein
MVKVAAPARKKRRSTKPVEMRTGLVGKLGPMPESAKLNNLGPVTDDRRDLNFKVPPEDWLAFRRMALALDMKLTEFQLHIMNHYRQTNPDNLPPEDTGL